MTPPPAAALFDTSHFEQTASQAGSEMLPLLKQALADGNASLRQAFEAGTDTVQLVHARAHFFDRLLAHTFNQIFGSQHTSICLLAVGGYGRGELHPSSDID